MTIAQIDTFVRTNEFDRHPVKVSFKSRDPFIGFFVNTPDYEELKGKNFWRIISQANIQTYMTTKDVSLARIFSGTEITKLKIVEMAG